MMATVPCMRWNCFLSVILGRAELLGKSGCCSLSFRVALPSSRSRTSLFLLKRGRRLPSSNWQPSRLDVALGRGVSIPICNGLKGNGCCCTWYWDYMGSSLSLRHLYNFTPTLSITWPNRYFGTKHKIWISHHQLTWRKRKRARG